MTANPRLARIAVLILLAIFVSYIDRGNLSTAAPLIKKELHLTPSQLGLLLSAFFMTYMSMQPVAGWLVDRFSAGSALALGFVLWSFATAATGLAGGFAALFACRLVLGVGESVTFPALGKICAENASESQRGLTTATCHAGVAFGPAFGVFFGGILIAAYGWRPFFIAFGLLSLLWVVAWMLLAQRHLACAKPHESARAPLGIILKERSLWGASFGEFCANYGFYFLLTWIPYYLVNERHWSLTQMAYIAGAAFLLLGVAMVLTGAICDKYVRAGASATSVRKTAFAVGNIGVCIGMLGCGFSHEHVAAAAWLLFAGAMSGVGGANMFVVSQTIAGAASAGRWIGVQNTVGNVAGVIAPSIAGVLVQYTGHFLAPFAIAAALSLCSAAFWVFMLGEVAPIDWATRTYRTPAAIAEA
ncbi:MAG: MFS transporter [Candidatus Eremiobacteraeota bacterium]|nr:MFS transporter [Candidatus Eremiobacteraeota bacterium]